MTRKNKPCSNCGIIPFEKYMKKLADQNLYCNDCRGALVDCGAKELRNLGHPYYLNFKKLKSENERLKNEKSQFHNQQRNKNQELAAIRQEKDKLITESTNLQTTLDKANQEIQTEREIHQDSLKLQDDWYRRLPPNDNNLKNILTEFAQKYLKLNWKNKVKKQRIKELESSLELVNQLANLQIQELQQVNQLLQEQLVESQQKNIALKVDLETLVGEKVEIQEDSQKVIQNHQQEILQLQQQIQQKELPKSINRFNFWKRS